jgi:hypothetical protein
LPNGPLENRLFSKLDFIDAFIGGLKPELRAFVRGFKPQSLEDAYDQACNWEGGVELQNRELKLVPKPSPTLPAPKLQQTNPIQRIP